MPTDGQNDSEGKQVINFIKNQIALGKSEEEIIAYFVERGSSEEDAKHAVASVYYLTSDYIEKQIALGKTIDEMIKDIIDRGADPEETKSLVSRIYLLKEMEKNAVKSLETVKRVNKYAENKALSRKGFRKMWRGGIILIIGTAITLLTYNNPIGDTYIIFYGAIIFGAIDFLIGLLQWQSNK